MSADHREAKYARADMRAEAIAHELLARGLPVIAASGFGDGTQVGVAFQLEGEAAKYAVRCPLDRATPEFFIEAYRIVA